jgi:F-type H+-transporting ATPase subunit epsilon
MLKLHVVTPEGQALEQEVDEVTVPGLLGEFGVLPGHVPLLAATKAGVLRYRMGAERGRLAIGPGFAQVDGQGSVVALVQKALATDKIDREGAEKLLADAEGRMLKESGPAETLAEADRAWAQAQLEAVKAN